MDHLALIIFVCFFSLLITAEQSAVTRENHVWSYVFFHQPVGHRSDRLHVQRRRSRDPQSLQVQVGPFKFLSFDARNARCSGTSWNITFARAQGRIAQRKERYVQRSFHARKRRAANRHGVFQLRTTHRHQKHNYCHGITAVVTYCFTAFTN